MNTIFQQRKKLIADWAKEIADRLGRSQEDILTRGLNAADFSSASTVELVFPDGSNVHFNYAFHVTCQSKNAISVFTEHCGYHVFPLVDTEIMSNE